MKNFEAGVGAFVSVACLFVMVFILKSELKNQDARIKAIETQLATKQ